MTDLIQYNHCLNELVWCRDVTSTQFELAEVARPFLLWPGNWGYIHAWLYVHFIFRIYKLHCWVLNTLSNILLLTPRKKIEDFKHLTAHQFGTTPLSTILDYCYNSCTGYNCENYVFYPCFLVCVSVHRMMVLLVLKRADHMKQDHKSPMMEWGAFYCTLPGEHSASIPAACCFGLM